MTLSRQDLIAARIVKDPTVKELNLKIKLSRTASGILHETHCGQQKGASRFIIPRTVSLYNRDAKRICSYCVYDAVYSHSPVLGNFLRFENILESLDAPYNITSLLDLFRIEEDLAYYHGLINLHLESSSEMPDSLRGRLLKAQEINVSDFKAKISKLQHSKAAKDKLEEVVLEEHEKSFSSTGFSQNPKRSPLDRKMVLISATTAGANIPELVVPLEIYSIFKSEKSLVAYAPAYVFYYLAKVSQGFSRHPKAPAQYHVSMAPDPGSAAARDAVAQVWTPFASWPLSGPNKTAKV